MGCQKLPRQLSYLSAPLVQCKMTGIEHMHLRLRDISLVGMGTFNREGRDIFSPQRQ